MARPRTINPAGDTRKVSVVVAVDVVEELEREARERGVSFGAVVRARLSPQPDPATEAVSA